MIYIVDEGDDVQFEHEGVTYVAYKRYYNDGTDDVEVYNPIDIGLDVSGEVQDIAEELVELTSFEVSQFKQMLDNTFSV